MLYFRKSNTQSSFKLVAQTEGPFSPYSLWPFILTSFLVTNSKLGILKIFIKANYEVIEVFILLLKLESYFESYFGNVK